MTSPHDAVSYSADLDRNLGENAVPGFVGDVQAASYFEFLAERRKLMAGLIRDYYRDL